MTNKKANAKKTESKDTESTSSEPYKKMTLKELGPNFPVIRRDANGKIIENRSFSFIEWDMAMEELISELREKSENTGKFVNQMFGELLDNFEGEDFQSKNDGQKTLAIKKLEFPNVMYMFIYLRVEELGTDLRMDLTCPRCKKAIKDFIADLNTLEVHVKDKEHQRLRTYELKKPIALGDKVITKLKYDVSTWSCLEDATEDISDNDGKMKRLMFESSICGVEDENGPVDHVDRKSVIGKLKKADIEKCIRDVVENNAGPSMLLKGDCPHCKAEFYKALEWRYEYFFDSSSL